MAQPKAPQVSFASAPTPPPADTTTAQAIQGFGKVAGSVVKGVQEARLQKSFTDTAEAAKTVNDITQSLSDQGQTADQVTSALKTAASFDPSKDDVTTLDGLNLPDNVKKKLLAVKQRAGEALLTLYLKDQ